MNSSTLASEVLNFKMYYPTSLSYADYRELIDKLLLKSKTTGSDQTENRVQFTRLNVERMKRLDKTIKIDNDTSDLLQKIDPLTWVVISEAWCGDCAQILPVLNKMVYASNNRINMRIVLRDENPELMNQFLTNHTRSVPKLIILKTSSQDIVTTWGPRPYEASKIASHWKNNMYSIEWTDFQKELHLWYAKDKGKSTIKEIANLLD